MLFVLPLVVVFGAISLAYIKHCIQNRIHHLIGLVDNCLVSADVEDPDQTPIKVLEMLDGIDTNDGDLSSDLIWDDSIEKNAQILIDEISNPRQEVNPKEISPKDQNYGHSNNTSIIDVNVDDYVKLQCRKIFG